MTETPVTTMSKPLNPWLVFLLPYVVYMLCGSLEPVASIAAVDPAKPHFLGWGPEYYPAVYIGKIIVTLISVVCVMRGYPRWQSNSMGLAILIGVIGVPVWVGLSMLQRQSGINIWMFGETRPNLNPWELFAEAPERIYLFLAFRIFGMALLVPVIEELFLRGFVMRYTQAEEWWQVPWGQIDRLALIVGTVLPVVSHPGEALAALAWFGMIHWLYWRTKNIWACVVAHAVTNLLLACYILYYKEWWLW